MDIKMGNIAECADPERNMPFPALFGYHRGNGSRGGAHTVPEHHRGDVQQMAEEHALQPEVAEEDDGVVVGLYGAVVGAVPFVAVTFQKSVKLFDAPIVHFLDVSGLQDGVVGPLIGEEEFWLRHPILGKPVPSNLLASGGVGTVDQRAEFPQPEAFFRTALHLLEGEGGGIFGAAQR